MCGILGSPNNSVSTHSRLKAAGLFLDGEPSFFTVSTHSRLKAAGSISSRVWREALFQHTAA